MAYTTDDILADAKLRSFYGGTSLADSDIIRLANDELLGIMTAKEMAGVQGLLALETTIPLVANQIRYDIPYRATAGKLRYIAIMDAQGNRTSIRPGRPERYVTGYNLTQTNNTPYASWFEDGRIVVFPAPTDVAQSIVIGFYIRPGRMVLAASSTTASAAAAGASSFTIAAAPAYLNGVTSIDIIRSKPPFQVIAYDLAVSSIATSATTVTITTPANLLYAIQAGDYVTKVEESVVPQLPAEAHPLLSARVAKRILQARGDLTNLEQVKEDIADLESNLFEFLSNRNEGQIDTLDTSNLLGGGRARYNFGLGGF